MGFTKAVAEKALFMTQPNSTVEKAMGWIEQHMEYPDFQEELVIVGQEAEDPNKPKLTKEEREKRAMELQKQIRAKQLAQEKQRAIENEANRKKQEKEL